MFVCNECQATSPKWMGKCSECETWNSFEEQPDIEKKGSRKKQFSYASSNAPIVSVPLGDIIPKNDARLHTGSAELDRVLGGGLLQGSVVLLGGEPGIGKSTLLLQVASHLNTVFQSLGNANSSVLYVCTEEAQEQIARRAKRIGVTNKDILISQEYKIENVEHLVHTHKPKCIIVDSIQALRSMDVSYTSGQGAHIRNCAAMCCEWSQQYNAIVIIVAHITKEGIIAGPKLIEHMVDTVLMFEKAKHNIRFLYAQKNRYGAVDEVGILQMTETGLKDIADVGLFFLEERNNKSPPGVFVSATFEGTRPFLVEIQSLTVPTVSNNRVYSDRIDARQISRISAVLERHLKLPMSTQNIYVNVAGGIRISEPGLELALALSLYSAYKEMSLPPKICAIGELSLPGEIHSVDNFSQRCRQAHEYGFTHILAPKRNVKEISTPPPIKIIPVHTIADAVKMIQTL